MGLVIIAALALGLLVESFNPAHWPGDTRWWER